MADDFTVLNASDHWLGWLGTDPARAVRDGIEELLRQQVSTAELDWVHLLEPPHYLTGGRKLPDDPNKIVVTRAGLAVPFDLRVSSAGRTDQLRGVFSWVAAGLDGTRRDRTYLDLDTDFRAAAEQLTARIYEVGSQADPGVGA